MNIFGSKEEDDLECSEAKVEGEQATTNVKVVSQVDLHVKSMVMRDCLELALMPPQVRAKVGDSYSSYSRVLPSHDKNHALVFDIVQKCRCVFNSMTSIRDPDHITCAKFERLASNKTLSKCNIMKVDLQLLFQKSLKQSTKTIDVLTFIEVMHLLYATCLANCGLEAVGGSFDGFMGKMMVGLTA